MTKKVTAVGVEMLPAAMEDLLLVMMEEPDPVPMFYMKNNLLAPVLDDEAKENTWQKILKNQH